MQRIVIPCLIAVVTGFSASRVIAQEEHGGSGVSMEDVRRLHALVRQMRTQSKTLRAAAGLQDEGRGGHGRRDVRREEDRREGCGEHGRGEHGRPDDRPRSAALRPIYNELMLLRREIRMLARDLKRKNK